MRTGCESLAFWRNVGCLVFVLLFVIWLSDGTSFSSRKRLRALEDSISNATLGFQEILVLNMPARTDHADWMRLTAAVTGLDLTFIDGVDGNDVLEKVLPYPSHKDLGNGNVGSWRAHMNAMAHIVSNNITSALVVEDDVDWDVRIKQQMTAFARGVRALSQPLAGSDRLYADPTFQKVRPEEPQHRHELLEDDDHLDFTHETIPRTVIPATSPYGDDWDVLWPGHCSMHFARAQDHVPKGRYLMVDDDTMIPKSKVSSADPRAWPGEYAEFTRMVHHAWDPVCTYAYAVSQRGARKILWEFGIKRFDRAFDNMMADFCDMNTCLTVQPQLFSAFAAPGPVNRDSEINGFGQDKSTTVRDEGGSENIQRSVRLNLQAILRGAPFVELQDQYPRS